MEEVVTNYELTRKARSAKREYRQDKVGRATVILNRLSLKLEDINIRTSSELLLSIRENRKKYKLVTNGFPKIIVSRLINVPVYTYGYNISSENIYEEHALLSRKYILSRYKK